MNHFYDKTNINLNVNYLLKDHISQISLRNLETKKFIIDRSYNIYTCHTNFVYKKYLQLSSISYRYIKQLLSNLVTS